MVYIYIYIELCDYSRGTYEGNNLYVCVCVCSSLLPPLPTTPLLPTAHSNSL